MGRSIRCGESIEWQSSGLQSRLVVVRAHFAALIELTECSAAWKRVCLGRRRSQVQFLPLRLMGVIDSGSLSWALGRPYNGAYGK